MKSKLTLFCLGVFAFVTLNAQEASTQALPKVPLIKSNEPVYTAPMKNSYFAKGGQVNDWFAFANSILNFAPNPQAFQGFVGFIFPDTNVIMTDDGDTARYWTQFHSFGQAIDPSDEIFAVQDPSLSVGQFHDRDRVKSVDSVAFRYLYIRNIETQDLGGGPQPVVDTIHVEFYKGRRRTASGTTYGLNSSWRFTPAGQAPNWFTRPEFDIPSQRGRTPLGTKTILLTLADTTGDVTDEDDGWRSPYMAVEVPNGGAALDSGEVFGYAVYYRPGSVYSVGDTIIATGPKKPSKRTANYFGFRFLHNTSTGVGDQIPQTKYYNNMYWMISGWNQEDANDPNRNALEYGFISGSLYDRQYFLESQFYMTGTSTLSAKELQNDYAIGTAYPNPVSSGSSIRMDYKSLNKQEVTIEVYDMLGKKVTSVVGNGLHNINTVEISTTGFETGMYVANMVVDGRIVAAKKFNVVK